MELTLETDIYEPRINNDGDYEDYLPPFGKYKNGLRCPCGARKDHVFDTRTSFIGHIKTKTHQKWLADLTHKKKILLFHLNGSSANRGSGKDKHEIAFSPDDSIWGKIDPAKSGAYAIVEFALKYDIPIICEINRGNAKECIRSLNKLKELSGV